MTVEAVAAGLDAILDPRSIAVIGASEDPGRIGGMPLHFLRSAGYTGSVYAVHPHRRNIQGVPTFAEIGAVPDPVDLAVVAVPAAHVLGVAEQCAAAGVRGAVIFSAGFAETGVEGARRQQELKRIADESGMRICGPNCAGVMNVAAGMTATFGSHLAADTRLVRGPIAIVSQSGAVGAYTFALARARNVGLSYWVTTGNEADTSVADYVEAIAPDPATRVIAIYLESMRDAHRLAPAVAAAQQHDVAVVALLAGKSEQASAALQSHSAAIASEHAVASAALRDLGVIEVSTIEDLLAVAVGLSAQPRPTGANLGVISMSGGIGILMLDRAVERGLHVPVLPTRTQQAMRELLPYAGTANPVDITGNFSNQPEVFAAFFEAMLASPELDGIACFLGHVLPAPVGRRFVDELCALNRRANKPIWLIGMDDEEHDVSRRLTAAQVPLFTDPVRAIDVLADVVAHGRRIRQSPAARLLSRRGHDAGRSRPAGATRVLSEVDSQRIAIRAGVSFPEQRLVTSAGAAKEAAAELGPGDVAVKIVAPDLLHKADVGGVLVGVRPDDAGHAYREVVTEVKERAPQLAVEGVLVQQQCDGVPVLVSVRNDPLFGPVVAFGAGGERAELHEDAALALAPVDLVGATELIARTRVGRRMRSVSSLSLERLAELLVGVSEFGWRERARLEELELNPVLVSDRAAVAVDAVVRWCGSDGADV